MLRLTVMQSYIFCIVSLLGNNASNNFVKIVLTVQISYGFCTLLVINAEIPKYISSKALHFEMSLQAQANAGPLKICVKAPASHVEQWSPIQHNDSFEEVDPMSRAECLD